MNPFKKRDWKDGELREQLVPTKECGKCGGLMLFNHYLGDDEFPWVCLDCGLREQKRPERRRAG